MHGTYGFELNEEKIAERENTVDSGQHNVT